MARQRSARGQGGGELPTHESRLRAQVESTFGVMSSRPPGRSSIAQRFSAGISAPRAESPGGGRQNLRGVLRPLSSLTGLLPEGSRSAKARSGYFSRECLEDATGPLAECRFSPAPTTIAGGRKDWYALIRETMSFAQHQWLLSVMSSFCSENLVCIQRIRFAVVRRRRCERDEKRGFPKIDQLASRVKMTLLQGPKLDPARVISHESGQHLLEIARGITAVFIPVTACS